MNKGEPIAAPEIKVLGNLMPSGHRAGSIYDTNGISPTVMDNHGYPAFILEKNNMCDDETAIPIFLGNCLNPKFTGCSYAGALWDAEGISPTLNTMQGGNRQPFVLISEKTMNSRLVDMLERGLIPNEDAVWIDTYNKAVSPGIAGTLRTTIDSSNMHYVSEMKQTPINTTEDGLAFTITARYGAMCATNLMGGGHYPMTGVMVEDDTAKTICLNAQVDGKQPSIQDRVYSPDGICTAITTGWLPNVVDILTCAMRGRGTDNRQALEFGSDVANSLTTVQKDSMIAELPRQQRIAYQKQQDGTIRGYDQASGMLMAEEQYYNIDNPAPALTVNQRTRIIVENSTTANVENQPKVQFLGNAYGYPSCGNRTYDVFDPNGLCCALRASGGGGSGFICVAIAEPMVMHDPRKSFGRVQPSSQVSPTLLSSDYKSPHLVMENITTPTRQERISYKEMPNGNIRAYDPTTADQRGVSEMQITDPKNEAPTLTCAHEMKIVERPQFTEDNLHIYNQQGKRIAVDMPTFVKAYNWFLMQIMPWSDGITRVVLADDLSHVYPVNIEEVKSKPRLRIRKPTPRECFRLMDVEDQYIDKIQEAGISKSQQYKLAGNSIVVNCMFHIFKNLFSNEIPANQQLSLF